MRTLAITGMHTVFMISRIIFGRGHARDAAFLADVGRNALERHHGAGSGVFGDARLLGVGDVHDDAALEHFREAHLYAPLIGSSIPVTSPSSQSFFFSSVKLQRNSNFLAVLGR